MAGRAPSESPSKRPAPMRDALKGLRKRITTTSSGEPRMKRTLKTVGGKFGRSLRKAPAAGLKLARGLGNRLKKKSN